MPEIIAHENISFDHEGNSFKWRNSRHAIGQEKTIGTNAKLNSLVNNFTFKNDGP